nr:MAG: major capsid protein [Microvirus sp.]
MSKSVMNHSFSNIPSTKIQRSTFNRSHSYKTTFDSGYLIPFFIDEALPGDTFNLKHTLLGRLNTPIVPIMDNLFLETFYFFVPNRLLWTNWEKFNGAQDKPADSTDYTIPTISPASTGIFAINSLADYFGLPTGIDLGIKTNPARVMISALWHRAYNKIWNEWFRDENLQDSVTVDTGDAATDDSAYTLLRRGKRHDYFTSALPWPQKGDAVTIDMDGTTAPIYGNGKALGFQTVLSNPYVKADDEYLRGTLRQNTYNTVTLGRYAYDQPVAMQGISTTQSDATAVVGIVGPEGESGMYADLSESAITTTINALRTGFQLQRMLERDARGGTRYTEIIRSHFGVISPDQRLQRPEYLGGSSKRIMINPVQQTSSTDATTPQGNLAAFGQVVDTSNGFTKTFTEHGVLMGLINVRADLTYQQGLPKMFQRQTRYDFYWPSLANLGEQAILNSEIYTQAYNEVDGDGNVENDLVFGYQERYAEYRYYPSKITSKLRSTAANSLDVWHLSQEFDALPVLGSTFIQDNPPISRIVAVNTEPEFTLDVFFEMKCARPMPVYSVPGLIDHF